MPPKSTKSCLYYGQTGDTKIGKLWVAISENQSLVAIESHMDRAEFEAYLCKRFKRPIQYAPKRLHEASEQLADYLSGERWAFTLPIDWTVMRPFQRSVLQATYDIPYGETRTYKQIAEQVGHPNSARAVGRAEATNPMPLVLPCHRVIGTDGKLHGYGMGDGIQTKEWLLKMEGALMA